MASSTIAKRSVAAAAAGTDTMLFIPASGQRVRLLGFYVANEGAAAAAGMTFEVRYGGNIIAICGWNNATAPIGAMSPEAIINHEIIGDGATGVVGRNLVVLAAGQIAAYVVVFDTSYLPTY